MITFDLAITSSKLLHHTTMIIMLLPQRPVPLLWLFLLGLSLAVGEQAQTKEREMWGGDILDDIDDSFQTTPSFCSSQMAMTMYMDGLHWSLFVQHPQRNCLNYFVNTWKLENSSAFRGACFFSFLLALLVEGLSAVRLKIIQSTRSHLALTAIYGIQGLLGYMIMIIVMSFSIELILSVVAGLIVGHWLLVMRIEEARPSRESPSPETTRPLLNAQQLRRRNQ